MVLLDLVLHELVLQYGLKTLIRRYVTPTRVLLHRPVVLVEALHGMLGLRRPKQIVSVFLDGIPTFKRELLYHR